MPFNHFAAMAGALWVIALCALVTVLRAFGFWRWLKYRWLDCKAYLFDAPGDDDDPLGSFGDQPTDWWTDAEIKPKPRPKRKRRPKKRDA